MRTLARRRISVTNDLPVEKESYNFWLNSLRRENCSANTLTGCSTGATAGVSTGAGVGAAAAFTVFVERLAVANLEDLVERLAVFVDLVLRGIFFDVYHIKFTIDLNADTSFTHNM